MPGKFKSWEKNYFHTTTLIDIYISQYFLSNYFGLANSKHSGLKAPEPLELGQIFKSSKFKYF